MITHDERMAALLADAEKLAADLRALLKADAHTLRRPPGKPPWRPPGPYWDKARLAAAYLASILGRPEPGRDEWLEAVSQGFQDLEAALAGKTRTPL